MTTSAATGVLDCASDQEFYRCARGPFTGCCSTNPCDTGVCSDDPCNNTATSAPHIVASTVAYGGLPPDSSLKTVTKTSVVATKTMTRTVDGDPSEVSTKTRDPSSSMSMSVAMSVSRSANMSGVHTETTNLGTKTHYTYYTAGGVYPVNPAASTTHHGSNIALIAGVVIAVIAAMVAGLLLWCCCRKKAKVGVNVTRKNRVKMQVSEEDKRAQNEIREQAAILAERERTLRHLEDRRTSGTGSVAGWHGSEVNKHKVWI